MFPGNIHDEYKYRHLKDPGVIMCVGDDGR